jgi:glycosyltransferase involved in cell wall biosynthesis
MAFFIAGISAPSEVAPATSLPSNVHFLSRCTPLELRQHYRSSQYYFQLSYFEGFGVALAEAMACGCIPVVSTACSLPETSGARPEYLLQQPDLETVNKFIADFSCRSRPNVKC